MKKLISTIITLSLLLAALALPCSAQAESRRPYRFVSCSMGYLVSAAVTDTGDLYCWGNGSKGQQGNGDTQNAPVPHRLLSGVKAVSAGYDHIAAVTTDGSLYTWGDNTRGQLGDGTTASAYTPKKSSGEMSR